MNAGAAGAEVRRGESREENPKTRPSQKARRMGHPQTVRKAKNYAEGTEEEGEEEKQRGREEERKRREPKTHPHKTRVGHPKPRAGNEVKGWKVRRR